MESVSYDTFQSSILVAAHYNRFDASLPYSSVAPILDFEHRLDPSASVRRSLLTAKLIQVTPLRALLSVSGESWILHEKVKSADAFTALKTTLRTWIAQLWSTPEPRTAPIKEALKLSVDILEQALQEQRDSLTLDMGTDMGIYFAALVLWAVTIAADTRVNKSQRKSQQPPPLLGPPSSTFTIAPTLSDQLLDTFSHPAAFATSAAQQALPMSQASTDSTCLLSHAQITINTISFLATALSDLSKKSSAAQLSSRNSRCQTGCVSLLLWVKLRLRGVPLDNCANGADAWACKPGEGLGELLDAVTGSLERILGSDWTGWSI